MTISFGPGISITGGGNFSAGTPLYPPTVTAVVVSGTTATVSFSAPPLANNPGVLYYVATSTPGNIAATGATSPIVVSGLSTGTSYTFSVSAVHGLGYGVSQSGSQNYQPAGPSSNYLYSWGLNDFGQLGLGNNTSYSSPKQLGSLTNWNFLATGARAVSAIKSDGTLWMWGNNGSGQLGLGNTTAISYSSPRQVGALTNWSMTAGSGYPFTVAVKTNGTLWAWGYNYGGQLGLGNRTYYSSPKQIGAQSTWKSVSASYGVLAIKTDGTLWAWGGNHFGGLGLGNTTYYSSPTQVGALTNWSSVASGYSTASIAIKTDGTLWAWGFNDAGQLGLGNTNAYSSPVQIGVLTTWSKVSTSAAGSFGIKTDGSLWSWGGNSYGVLGLGNTTYYSSPKQVGALTTWSKVATGSFHSMAIKSDGTLWAWGYNNNGQLGQGNLTNYSSPCQIGVLTSWNSIAGASYTAFAINSVPGLSAPNAPTTVTATATGSTTAAVSYTAPATGSTATSFVAVSTPGGITGTTSTSGSGTVTVSGLSPLTAYTFQVYGSNSAGTGIWSAASNTITTPKPTNGYLYSWGSNVVGSLGLGNNTNYSSPKQVGSLNNWKTIQSNNGYTNMALKSDGTLWMWGWGNHGVLGQGNSTYYSSPKQVGALTSWSKLAPGYSSALAIRTDGSLWAWGYNGQGVLGLGNNTNYSSPVQIGNLTTWLNVAAGYYHAVAVKTDGTLWSWGKNSGNTFGALGLGNTVSYSSPKQVGALTNWNTVVAVYPGFTFAIKQDGTLWSWGGTAFGNQGALGLGNRNSYSSPVQVGALTNWSTISSEYYFAMATKTDGTLWAWGQNNYGQLGLGNTTYYSSPKQVGALTTWSQVVAGQSHAMAVKTDGTLWSWGWNNFINGGMLGLGNTINYSSPKQVGALTTWINVGAGGVDSYGIHT